MPLKAVIIDRKTLISHDTFTEDLQKLLEGLYHYNILVMDLPFAAGMMKSFGISFQDVLVIADCEATVAEAKTWQAAALGYETRDRERARKEGWEIKSHLDFLVQGFAEVDFHFLQRIYQRFHHIPWQVLETKRCYLREITLEDLDTLYELYHDEEITRYMEGLYENREKEEEYTRDYIQNMYEYYGYGVWIVVEKETGAIIGRAGLSHLEIDGVVELELGYMIGKKYQHRGYAAEVCQGILEFAEELPGFHSIYCLIEKENGISIHLAEKLGFSWDKTVLCDGKEMQRYAKTLHF